MIALAFIFNFTCNFLIGILLAKILGPAEFGRYSLALSTAIVLQSLGLDWLRLCALRFYSPKRHAERPEVRATTDLSFALLAGLTLLAAGALLLFGAWLPSSVDYLPIALAVCVAIGVFEMTAAVMRAAFRNQAYGFFVIAKNVLSLGLSLGGAYWFGSARIALAGLVASIAGSLLLSRFMTLDHGVNLRLADPKLALRFASYAFPVVFANVLYQLIPMINRTILSQVHDFAQAGQMSLAFDIGVRAFGSIGSLLDMLLFQLAITAEHEHGTDAAFRQVERNMGLIIAVLLPAIAGFWLVLPSVEYLIIPQAFRGPFAHYFTLLIPAFLGAAIINQVLTPAFQIMHRTAPLIWGGIVAVVVDCAGIVFLPETVDASKIVEAQSLSALAGLMTVVAFLWRGHPLWPPRRDLAGAILGVAIMIATVMPLQALAPGAGTLLLQAALGGSVYALVVVCCDVAGARRLIMTMATAHKTVGVRGA